ncbi:MAG TPA: glycerate kinase [Candidatus Limnocylindria bacterium]|nr:glycerate kinase [Candidatus Limnocylindria bacterium]
MRVVIAPDKFKGSLDAAGVAAALAAGLREIEPDAVCELIPMADGGDGTVEAFLADGAEPRTVRVCGPVGAPVDATYAQAGATAVIEMAAACGLALLGDRLDALRATTRGTGELLLDALDRGATRIVLGIGGSATTDGGAGALAALGARFLDARGIALDPTPRALAELDRIDLCALDPRVRAVDLAIACDVDNPLLGPHGAAAIYGPQKGATPDDVVFLDGVLRRLADAMSVATGRDLRELPGAGAAGGLGWGLAAACGARLQPGVTLVAEVRGLANALRGADLCLTGEGRIDDQTLRGKVVAGVAALAREAGVPVIAFGGSVQTAVEPELRAHGVRCVPIVPGPISLETAMREAETNLRAAAARVAALLRPSTVAR